MGEVACSIGTHTHARTFGRLSRGSWVVARLTTSLLCWAVLCCVQNDVRAVLRSHVRDDRHLVCAGNIWGVHRCMQTSSHAHLIQATEKLEGFRLLVMIAKGDFSSFASTSIFRPPVLPRCQTVSEKEYVTFLLSLLETVANGSAKPLKVRGWFTHRLSHIHHARLHKQSHDTSTGGMERGQANHQRHLQTGV